MGGNAIKDAVRLNAGEYGNVQNEILTKLERRADGYFTCPESYSTKESFGDLDIVVSGYAPEELTNLILLEFEIPVKDMAINKAKDGKSAVISVPYALPDGRIFQVDFILLGQPLTHGFATSYFDYNDLGNLMGVIANNMGFKFGHLGLNYAYYGKPGEFEEDVLVTINFQQALTFLGFDSTRWYKGFDTKEDMFEFVASSEFFDPALYSLESRNNANRVRDVKRTTYMDFLAWIEEHKPAAKVCPGKEDAFAMALDRFPNFKDNLSFAESEYAKKVEAREWFNGTVVGEITGLSYNRLGLFMDYLRNIDILRDGVQTYIRRPNASKKELHDRIRLEFNKLRIIAGTL